MKTYSGYRTPQGCVIKVHEGDGSARDLPPTSSATTTKPRTSTRTSSGRPSAACPTMAGP